MATSATGTGAFISIHALREEGDLLQCRPCAVKEISIHALREEGDCHASTSPMMKQRFLSTPSARRATRYSLFSSLVCVISIHALREEGDKRAPAGAFLVRVFLSTPSARRATR